MNYSDQDNWKRIMSFLPPEFHFTEQYTPTGEYWDWKGNLVHLDTSRNASAKAKIILLHGVGTNGRQISTIIGGPLAKDGYEVVAIDMPLCGVIEVNKKMIISYEDWVQPGNDYVNHEWGRDNRPIFLYSLSAGGMETYHIACKNRNIKGIIGTTFLDQKNQQVCNEATNNVFWAHLGTPLVGLATRLGFGRMRMKISTCSKMSALCDHQDCLNELLADKTSAGNAVPMKFIHSCMEYTPETSPGDFGFCLILLTQPEKDRWTPLHLGKPFLNQIKKIPVTITILEDGGHYPVEPPALDQLHRHITTFIAENMQASNRFRLYAANHIHPTINLHPPN